MKISNYGLNKLKMYESAVMQNGRHVIYDDKTGRPVPFGVPLPPGATIGYGHLIQHGEDFRCGLGEDKATELLQQDIGKAQNAISENITAPLTQNQFDALVLLVYNIGTTAFKNSTIRKYINNPNYRSNKYPTAESAWKAFNKSGGTVIRGLVNRRNYEWDLFVSDKKPS